MVLAAAAVAAVAAAAAAAAAAALRLAGGQGLAKAEGEGEDSSCSFGCCSSCLPDRALTIFDPASTRNNFLPVRSLPRPVLSTFGRGSPMVQSWPGNFGEAGGLS